MKPWNDRPPDVARLLNPAFCGRLLLHTVVEHQPDPLPYVMMPLILPFILHRKTRDSLPTSVRSPFISWIEEHSDIRIGLADRVARALPVSRESLLFMVNAGWLSLRDGGISSPRSRAPRSHPRDTDEIKDCVLKARLLGRWLAGAGRPATIYAALAITP